MIWYKELGFYNNPLSIKPGAFHDCLIGHEEIIGRIEANILNKRHSFVEGDYGEGKTQVLKRLINDFGGNKKVAYYNPSSGMFDIENLLKKRYGFFGRLFGLMPSDIVLLLDEAHTLLKPELQKIDTFIQDGNIKSVVLVGRKFEKMNIPEFLKSSDTFQLKSLSPDDAVKLVRKRVCSLHLLSDGVIKKIFEYSNENPRELLKNTEQILKRAYEHGEEKVTDEGIKAFFAGEPKKKVKEQVKEEKTKRAQREEDSEGEEYY